MHSPGSVNGKRVSRVEPPAQVVKYGHFSCISTKHFSAVCHNSRSYTGQANAVSHSLPEGNKKRCSWLSPVCRSWASGDISMVSQLQFTMKGIVLHFSPYSMWMESDTHGYSAECQLVKPLFCPSCSPSSPSLGFNIAPRPLNSSVSSKILFYDCELVWQNRHKYRLMSAAVLCAQLHWPLKWVITERFGKHSFGS